MAGAFKCPECGDVIAANQPNGLCSRCALMGALKLGEETPPANRAPLTPGGPPQHIGDYELLEEIARGGMGVVYKARQKSLERNVAIKMLLSGQHATEDQVRRFKVEAIAAGTLHHPNIVAVHEVGSHEGMPYFAMDLVDGPNLARMLRNGLLPAKRAAGYVKTIAEAIQYAHGKNILHRDLKPSNVLIDSNDQPKVTDFGLAKNLANDSDLTITGQVYGSPSFMSPEQAAGQRDKVGVTSDVYSLGAILYHALTGRPPFVGQTVTETLKQVEYAEPIAPSLLNPGLPRDIETICLKCLRKEPGRRYGSAQELADELGRFLRDEPIHARPVSRVEKVWRWGRRNPLAAAFVGTVCVALVTSLSLLYLVNQAKNKQVELTREVKDANRELSASTKVILSLTDESLDNIWANKSKRSIELKSEIVAAIANTPGPVVTNAATVVRWTMGLLVDAVPGAVVRNSAFLLSRLEEATSHTLGRQVRVDVKLYKFQEDFDTDLSSGAIDFGRMGALRFLRAKRRTPNVTPLVIPSTSYKTGVLFTTTRTDIRTIEDVRGRRFAFGDTNSTVSFWAEIKLAEQGITATNLSRYDHLDSTLEFADDVAELGYSNAVSRIGHLHSHSQVIEGVLSGRYDVGVAMKKYLLYKQDPKLVFIPGSEFQSSRAVIAARPGLDPKHAQAIINALTGFQGAWLESLPDHSTYQVFNPDSYATEERWLDRITTLFPPKP